MAHTAIDTQPSAAGEASGFAFFETVIGRCSIAWRGGRVMAMQLPEADDATARARLLRDYPQLMQAAPPPFIATAIEGITQSIAGAHADLSSIELETDSLPAFHRRVYEIARTIPPGQTRTYGEIAKQLGSPGAARAIGQALGRNPFLFIVPCHRVFAANGKTGGFSAHGGVHTKLRLLTLERAHVFDPATALAHLRQSDPILAKLIRRTGPFAPELSDAPSVFAALAESLVHQQLSRKAAGTIFARLCSACGPEDTWPAPGDILRMTPEELREVGLSRAKAAALVDLAEHVESGRIPDLPALRTLPDETIIEALTQVRGVGRWTAEMFLIFRLGRPDVLALDDLGIRKGFQLTYGLDQLPDRQTLLNAGKHWIPFRSVASWYLWRSLELDPPPTRQMEMNVPAAS